MLFQKNQKKISSILKTIYKPSLNERDIDHLKDQIIQIIKKLATQGNTFSREKFRSLKATYYRSALDLIDIYRSDAAMNGLELDSHTEEKAVELFAINIMKAGEAFIQNPMDTPFIPTWSRVKSAIPDFLGRLEKVVNDDNKKYS